MTSRFQTVPPAVHPSNTDLQAERGRQATFERGVALALVASMQTQMRHLTTLTTGLRWLYAEEDASAVKRWLDNLRSDILRAERIEERAAHE